MIIIAMHENPYRTVLTLLSNFSNIVYPPEKIPDRFARDF
jgi:hypothetical protein